MKKDTYTLITSNWQMCNVLSREKTFTQKVRQDNQWHPKTKVGVYYSIANLMQKNQNSISGG